MVNFVLGVVVIALPFGALIYLLSRAQARRYPRGRHDAGEASTFWWWPVGHARGDESCGDKGSDSACDPGDSGGTDAGGSDGSGSSE